MKMIEKLSHEVIGALLDALPVDITFVDEDDRVQYFNKEGKQIFARSRKIIGIKVQKCHPQKSIHVVNQILDDFRNNKRDSANFWIDLKGRKIYIRYFAVRDKEGKYLGCLEVTQDITDIQKITGEKRLLDQQP
jgi:PAS domain S-box-containing protein